MQISLILTPYEPLEIPLNYNYQLQSAIYSKLKEVGASDFWHDSGFGEKETFKFFVFSPLSGNYKIVDKKIIFQDKINLEIRSPFFEFCDDLQRSIELNPTIKIFNQVLHVSGAFFNNRHINSDSVIFKTISPIMLSEKTEAEKTVFIKPVSPDFVYRLQENFYKKYKAVFDGQPPELKIELLEEGKKVVTRYKEIWLTGYHCTLKITGPDHALEFIYNTGLGERNSQGFGLMDIIQ